MKKVTTLILILFTLTNAYSQPCTKVKELKRKQYHVDGAIKKHPYTMFDRHNGLTFHQSIENIRNRIQSEKTEFNEGPVFTAYKELYNRAIQSMPLNIEGNTDDGLITKNSEKGPSARAFWAKENAFVFLIGLDANGNEINDLSQREVFKNNAIQAFDNLNGKIESNLFNLLDLAETLTIPLISQTYKESYQYHQAQFYSRSLIMWLQTYDLLMASGELPELASIKYTSTPNSGICTHRNKLRKLTRDLYKLSKGNLGIVEHKLGWKKNHGIAAASALLMAAQVLNDAGVERYIKNFT